MYPKLAKRGRNQHSHGRLEEVIRIAIDGRQSPITVLLIRATHFTALLLHKVHSMK